MSYLISLKTCYNGMRHCRVIVPNASRSYSAVIHIFLIFDRSCCIGLQRDLSERGRVLCPSPSSPADLRPDLHQTEKHRRHPTIIKLRNDSRDRSPRMRSNGLCRSRVPLSIIASVDHLPHRSSQATTKEPSQCLVGVATTIGLTTCSVPQI